MKGEDGKPLNCSDVTILWCKGFLIASNFLFLTFFQLWHGMYGVDCRGRVMIKGG